MNYSIAAFLMLALVNVVQLVRWFYKKRRNADIAQNFIRDMAINHLPHLYHGQILICRHLGIEMTEPPRIQFIELNGEGK